MIGTSYETKKAKEEIEKIMNSSATSEHKRNQIGKVLFDLARFHGGQYSNLIIDELQLQSKMNIQKIPVNS